MTERSIVGSGYSYRMIRWRTHFSLARNLGSSIRYKSHRKPTAGDKPIIVNHEIISLLMRHRFASKYRAMQKQWTETACTGTEMRVCSIEQWLKLKTTSPASGNHCKYSPEKCDVTSLSSSFMSHASIYVVSEQLSRSRALWKIWLWNKQTVLTVSGWDQQNEFFQSQIK